jgi:hypothetical protein
VGRRGTAIIVGNILYWITKKAKLLAYDLDLDLWLLGSIEGPGIPWVICQRWHLPHLPCLIHLEDQRFCIIQRTADNNHYILCFHHQIPDGSSCYHHALPFTVSLIAFSLSIFLSFNYQTLTFHIINYSLIIFIFIFIF